MKIIIMKKPMLQFKMKKDEIMREKVLKEKV